MKFKNIFRKTVFAKVWLAGLVPGMTKELLRAGLESLPGMPSLKDLYYKHRGYAKTGSSVLTFSNHQEATAAIQLLHYQVIPELYCQRPLTANYAREAVNGFSNTLKSHLY